MSSSTGIHVAIVDDDDSLCRSLGRLLRTAGIQLATYHSAELFLADAARPRFDCLLLDVQLEGMSGIELNERLQSEGAAIPVIFNTAHDEPEVRQRAVQTGCVAYLLKTEPGASVLAAIGRAVSEAAVG